jgi:hypothetical protein
VIPLSKEKISEIDEIIDSSIKAQPLLSQPRDRAIMNLLRYFEDYVRLYGPTITAKRSTEDFQTLIKNGQDGMHFAIKWIFQYCSPIMQRTKLAFDENAYLQAAELHKAATRYSVIWDFMSLLHRGRVIGELESDETIRLRYASPLSDFEIAGRLLNGPDPPDKDNTVFSSQHLDPGWLLSNVKVRHFGQGKVKYDTPNIVFDRVADSQEKLLSHLWELDGSWDLGGYTISQFRDFWIALASLCFIHHWVCLSSRSEAGALNSVVRVLKREVWQKELVRRSGLKRHTVSAILTDIIYDDSLYEPGKKHPDVTYQPFFPIDSELIALSNWLVLSSNAERNIWDLISIKRPSLHSSLRNEKEQHWLQELKPKLESYGLKVYGPINFTYNKRNSDLDILILDNKTMFGLGCQLKWLTGPDRIRDVKYTDDELVKGIAQAKLSLGWLNSRPMEIRNIIGLSSSDMAVYEFKGMVLSKNTMGSAWVNEPDIPVVSERLLHWILGNPHRRSLQVLWRVGEEHRYVPKRGKHFVDADVPVEFEGIRFLGEGLGMSSKTPWHPLKDIDLNGIS